MHIYIYIYFVKYCVFFLFLFLFFLSCYYYLIVLFFGNKNPNYGTYIYIFNNVLLFGYNLNLLAKIFSNTYLRYLSLRCVVTHSYMAN